nr:hypothetical protein [Tanacetum cinerariifolium]
MTSRKRKNPNDADISALHKEWDDISCPICMDHPHNAVRILCSAHEKGCTSFICDTSYRHSNCLDRFKKLITSDTDDTTATTPPSLIPINDNSTDANAIGYVELAGEPEDASNNISSSPSKSSLKCPLCRGSVSGYEVVEEARQYLNLKHRSCSQESCTFSGTYRELRRHARRAHPTARPSDVDPTRERAWRRLEHQREYGDIVSAIRSAMPDQMKINHEESDKNKLKPSDSPTPCSRFASSSWRAALSSLHPLLMYDFAFCIRLLMDWMS